MSLVTDTDSPEALVERRPKALKAYVQELQMEMRRVTWPTWKQVRATTGVVLACVFAFAAYFYVVDLVVGRAINRVIALFTQ